MRLIQKPDWDPNNPYHYHVNGKKIVITKEDWEKYKDDPTFKEVRTAVETEQAAHPEPEYDEVENPAWRQAYQRLVNGVNLKGRSNYNQPLPQGYTRDEKGIAMDEQGNYYIPVETATNAPYFVNQERGTMGHTIPVRYEQQQIPNMTIRQFRQPLPIDRVMNVDAERDNAINNYINSNTQYVQMYRRPYFKSDADPVIWVYGEKNALPSTSYADGRGDAFGWHGFDIYDNDSKDAKQYSVNNLITEEEFKKAIDLIPGWGNYINVQNPNLWIDKKIARKPSQQEAEKKAVIKVGDLEKVGTFAKGGKLINKYQIGGPYKRDSHTGVIYLPYVSKIKPYDDSKTSVQLNKPVLSLTGDSMEMDNKLLTELDDYLKSRNVGLPQRQAILYNVVQEGSTTKSHGNGAYGLLGWKGVRIPGKGINQMEYLYNTIFGKYNANHWKDGGDGSGYMSGREAQQAFINAETVEDALNALTYGYVRPGLEQREFRSKTKYFNEDEKVN